MGLISFFLDLFKRKKPAYGCGAIRIGDFTNAENVLEQSISEFEIEFGHQLKLDREAGHWRIQGFKSAAESMRFGVLFNIQFERVIKNQ